MNKVPQAIILRPIVSEKGTQLLTENKYLFEVPLKVNKIEIKKGVEELFKVKVQSVRTMHARGKSKKWRGREIGKIPRWKKAIVRLKEGEVIEDLGA